MARGSIKPALRGAGSGKAGAIELVLAQLRRLDPADPAAFDIVRRALVVKAPHASVAVVAAAKAVEEHGLQAVTPELVEAFTQLCKPKSDPGCRGRAAIVHTLHALEHWAPEVFEVGLTLVQLEGDPSERYDVAAQIRGACAQAHVHLVRPDALDVCAEMLADPEVAARLGAARGIADCGRLDATAVLRYKLVLAPDDGEVLAACFDGLFVLHRESAIDFARRMLARPDARGDAAALALGSHRVFEATAELIAWCAQPMRSSVGSLALALLRSDAGNAALAAAIRTGSAMKARDAAEALATFKHEPAIAELIVAAAKSIKDKQLRDELGALAR